MDVNNYAHSYCLNVINNVTLCYAIKEHAIKVHNASGEHVHYLPHHAVIRHDKDPTKMKVVYDASARSMEPSLNDCLYVGPKFNQHNEHSIEIKVAQMCFCG